MRFLLAAHNLDNFHDKGICAVLADCFGQLPGLVLCECALDVLLESTLQGTSNGTVYNRRDTYIYEGFDLQPIDDVVAIYTLFALTDG